MKNKKAISHVEIIISFIIFISFVVFLLVMLNPLKVSERNANYIDISETKIIDKISTGLTVVSLKINSETYATLDNKDCFSIKIENPLGNILVKNITAGKLTSEIQGGKIEISKSGDFYRLYFSNELTETLGNLLNGCKDLGEDYILGVPRTYEIVSYSKLNEFNRSYNIDYQNLKEEQLGLNNDFSFVLNKYPVNFSGEKYKPRGINVIARDIPITILDSEGNLDPAVLNIQVWGS